MNTLYTITGAILLLFLVWDVHETVFVPHGPAGPLSRPLYRWSWRIWHRLIGHRTPQARRRLAQLGPLLIPLTVLLWSGILLLGFMLLLLPYASTFEVDHKVAFPAWFNALYISAYSISTLGIGDVTPNGELARMIMVAAATSGFILITVSVTYLLSVYGALERMTALAFEIHRFIGRSEGETPPRVLALAITSQSTAELSSWLASTTTMISQVVQSDDEFPLLHFFHMTNERSLPLALADLLELVTLCRALLSPVAFPSLAGGIVTAGTERVTRSYFVGLDRKFIPKALDPDEEWAERSRRLAFERAWETLEVAGVALRERPEAEELYFGMRREWDAQDRRLRRHFGYPIFDTTERYAGFEVPAEPKASLD